MKKLFWLGVFVLFAVSCSTNEAAFQAKSEESSELIVVIESSFNNGVPASTAVFLTPKNQLSNADKLNSQVAALEASLSSGKSAELLQPHGDGNLLLAEICCLKNFHEAFGVNQRQSHAWHLGILKKY
ncbi:MAG: hypothetical protein AAGD96_24685 [Chloroflexota bacterium]